MVTVRRLDRSDWDEWRRMRCALWPDERGVHAAEMRDLLAAPDAAVFVAVRAEGGLCGFAEASVRSFAEGCTTRPVAYLEGWYVDPDARRRGAGRALVEAVERWARERGLRELASDATLDNAVSHRAHEATGFVEVDRAVHYRKALGATSEDGDA